MSSTNRVIQLLEEANVDFDQYVNSDGVPHAIMVCPFHEDHAPSLSISLKHGGFYCFSCQAQGRFPKLYAELTGVDKETAERKWRSGETVLDIARQLKDEFEIIPRQDTFLDYAWFDKTFPPVAEIQEGADYLIGRRLKSRKLWQAFDIRFGIAGKYVDRIVLPIYDVRGRLISFTARTIHGEEVKPKTKKARPPHSTLYGLYELRQRHKSLHNVVLVEGEFDCLFLQMLGVPALSVMGTKGLWARQIALLISNQVSSITLCYDGDKAGVRATLRDTASLTRFASVTSIALPAGKDPDELSAPQLRRYFGTYIKPA